jgi:hypothetical protein
MSSGMRLALYNKQGRMLLCAAIKLTRAIWKNKIVLETTEITAENAS